MSTHITGSSTSPTLMQHDNCVFPPLWLVSSANAHSTQTLNQSSEALIQSSLTTQTLPLTSMSLLTHPTSSLTQASETLAKATQSTQTLTHSSAGKSTTSRRRSGLLKCHFCGERFMSYFDRIDHEARTHLGDERRSAKLQRRLSVAQCETCGKVFNRKYGRIPRENLYLRKYVCMRCDVACGDYDKPLRTHCPTPDTDVGATSTPTGTRSSPTTTPVSSMGSPGTPREIRVPQTSADVKPEQPSSAVVGVKPEPNWDPGYPEQTSGATTQGVTKGALKPEPIVEEPTTLPQNDGNTRPEGNTTATLFTCEFCQQDFVERTEFFQHLRRVHPEAHYSCRRCGEGFACASTLRVHIQTTHGPSRQRRPHRARGISGSLEPKRNKTETKPCKCRFCNQQFSCMRNLHNHYLSQHYSRQRQREQEVPKASLNALKKSETETKRLALFAPSMPSFPGYQSKRFGARSNSL